MIGCSQRITRRLFGYKLRCASLVPHSLVTERPLSHRAKGTNGSDPEVASGAKRSLGQDFRATTSYRSITVDPSAIPQRLL